MMVQVNVVSVLVAAIASMVVGFLWYSPMLFGKPWMKLMGIKPSDMKSKQKQMMPMYGLSFVSTILMAFVFYHFVIQGQYFYNISLLSASLASGFWAWLGFIMPVQLTDVIFGGKKWMLFAINTGYQLTGVLAMALVFGLIG